MQYQSECLEALKSAAKISKSFEKVFMDTLKLFMAIPGKVNFLQMGRYGEFSEQTYRNNFANETFDWLSFNEHLVRKALTGSLLAIAVDPSFLPKSGKKTPWIGRFWSGVAGEMKRGQEIFGVGVIDVDNHDCMTLGAIQTPDAKSLEGMDYNLGRENGDTFTRNQHPDLRADFVLANPPFNISDWWHGSLEGDPRWVYGTPPAGNANYAWLQHMLYHLKPTGRAGIVLANGSMSSSQNSEGDIRRAMVEADVVECMVALPGQLFFNTQIPACLWFLAKSKRSRPGEVLFIDARKLGTMVSRVQCELDEAAIAKIADTFHAWKGDGECDQPYEDVAGFCRSVTLAEIAEHGHVLTPGRYVGAEEVEEDDEAFADKMARLTKQLGGQMSKGAELDQLIKQKLGGLGYVF